MTDKGAVGISVRSLATSRSERLGLLVRDSVIEVGEHSTDGKWARIARIIEGGIEPVTLSGAVPPQAAHGWVFLGELDPDASPEVFDETVVLATPYPMKQGDVVGYLGEDVPAGANPVAGQPVSRKLLHLEVFSGDDVPAYLSASRQWAKQNLPNKDRTLLLLRPGDALLDAPNGKVAYTIKSAQVLSLTGTEAKEMDGARWCKVTRPEFAGWIKEADHLASPWEWPGFEVVDEPNSPSGAFWKDAAEKAGFIKREGPRPEKTPLYEALVKRLDTNRDGRLTEQELDAALRNRSQAAFIGRLIVRHESEWAKVPATLQQAMARAIAQYLGVGALKQVEEEITRAELLPWWDEAAGGVVKFPENPRVYHFHPGGLAGNFSSVESPTSTCAEKFRKVSPIILRHEGGFVNDPDDPGGATNMGIAWPTWKAYAMSDLGQEPTLQNLKALTREGAEKIYLKRYWEPKGFCGIENTKTALMIYDWTITSGKAMREVQRVLNGEFGKQIAVNNVMGRITIDAINSIADQEHLVQRIGVSRKAYYTSLTVDSKGIPNAKVKFLKGWHNRVDDCLRASP